MENRMKLRLSRMFRASFGSCRTRNTPDVIEKAVFVPQNRTYHFRVFEPPPPPPSPPKPRPFRSICKPQTGPRQKVSDRYYSPLGLADTCVSTCPPVSPISPFMYYTKERKKKKGKGQRSRSKHKSKKKKKNNNKSRVKSTDRESRLLTSSSRDNSAYYSWLSTDEEEEETDTHTLFSSRSTTLSSDSSRSLHRMSRRSLRRERVGSRKSEIGALSTNALPLMEEGRVKDSFAVVKKSSDPYNDFRTSMVEMIVEKQIFGAQDLEKLLQLFLSLNSDCHHRIIVEVFMEIWEALFSDWS